MITNLIRSAVKLLHRLILVMVMLPACQRNEARTQEKDPRSQAAGTAYNQFQLKKAVALWSEILHDEAATIKNRTRSGRNLSNAYQRLYLDPGEALNVIKFTISLQPENPESLLKLAENLREHKSYDESLDVVQSVIDQKPPDKLLVRAYSIYAKTVIDLVFSGKESTQVMELTKRAISLVDLVLQKDPATYDRYLDQFRLACLTKDSKLATSAYSRYFLLQLDSTGYHSQLFKNRDRLSQIDFLDNEQLVQIFLELGFYDLAGYYGQFISHSAYPEVFAFLEYLQEIKAMTLEFYKSSLVRKESVEAFDEKTSAIERKLWDTISQSETEYSKASFSELLEREFKVIIRNEWANGWYSYFLGHLIVDIPIEISQEGYKGKFRFTSIDQVVSRGFTDWYFNSYGNIAGWASPGRIYEVRPANVDAAIYAWKSITDSTLVSFHREIMKREEVAEKVIEKNQFDRSPKSVAIKFLYSAYEQLHDSLTANYASEENGFFWYFVANYHQADFQQSIVAHEGRHAIDLQRAALSASEYTAKLAEIRYAALPKLTMGKILNYGFPDNPHGRANKRIVQGFVKWLSSNHIDSMNPDQPLILQLHKLSNEQIRRIAEELDPLSRK